MNTVRHLLRAELAVQVAERSLRRLVVEGGHMVAVEVLSCLIQVRGVLSLGHIPDKKSVQNLEAAIKKADQYFQRRVPRQRALALSSS